MLKDWSWELSWDCLGDALGALGLQRRPSAQQNLHSEFSPPPLGRYFVHEFVMLDFLLQVFFGCVLECLLIQFLKYFGMMFDVSFDVF